MRAISAVFAGVLIVLTISGCSSSMHGSYAPVSYVSDEVGKRSEALGPVRGTSCQTRLLYVLPIGPGVSTGEAIRDAKIQQAGTRYLADLSIDDRIYWGVLYSEQCITVDAIAY